MLWPIFVLVHPCGMPACEPWLSDSPSVSTSHRTSLKVSGSQVTPQWVFQLELTTTVASHASHPKGSLLSCTQFLEKIIELFVDKRVNGPTLERVVWQHFPQVSSKNLGPSQKWPTFGPCPLGNVCTKAVHKLAAQWCWCAWFDVDIQTHLRHPFVFGESTRIVLKTRLSCKWKRSPKQLSCLPTWMPSIGRIRRSVAQTAQYLFFSHIAVSNKEEFQQIIVRLASRQGARRCHGAHIFTPA